MSISATWCAATKNEAVEDMVGIYKYSAMTFGERKADEYYEGLEQFMDDLAYGEPVISCDYNHIKAGLRRSNYQSHSIYYRKEDDAIVVSRVLHSRMEGALHIN